MTRTALVNQTTNVVDNVVVVGEHYLAPSGHGAVASDGADIGDTYDGAKFTPPAPAPPGPDALVGYAKIKQQALFAAGVTVNVAEPGESAVSVLCDGTNDTRADLGLLAQFGQANPTATKLWLDNDGKATVLTGTQLVALATLVGNWIADTYPALADVVGRIAAGTISTYAQVDAYPWPIA